jgi:hypothetical protein
MVGNAKHNVDLFCIEPKTIDLVGLRQSPNANARGLWRDQSSINTRNSPRRNHFRQVPRSSATFDQDGRSRELLVDADLGWHCSRLDDLMA